MPSTRRNGAEPQRLDGRRVGRGEQQWPSMRPRSQVQVKLPESAPVAVIGASVRQAPVWRLESGELAAPILGAAVHQEVHRQPAAAGREAARARTSRRRRDKSAASASLTGDGARRSAGRRGAAPAPRARPGATGRHRCGWRRRRCRRRARAAAAGRSRSPDSRRHGRGSWPRSQSSATRQAHAVGGGLRAGLRPLAGAARAATKLSPCAELAHGRAAHRARSRPRRAPARPRAGRRPSAHNRWRWSGPRPSRRRRRARMSGSRAWPRSPSDSRSRGAPAATAKMS